MERLLDRTVTWIASLAMAFMAVFTNNADAVGLAIMLSLLLVVLDFCTGIMASLCEGKSISSKRIRWSFAKTVVYAASLVLTLAIGVSLHMIEGFSTEPTKTTLAITLTIVKFEAYVIAYIEVLSNIENLRRIFPNNLFLKYIHWILSVEIIKKIPKFSEFLKERENNKKFK